MITKITGRVRRVEDEAVTLAVGAFEYEVLIPEFVRRQLQSQLEQDVALFTIEYLEGNAMQGHMTPRLVGFLTEIEREFFELFTSVDGVGVKKALRAMVRPVREVAIAIEEQDIKELSALPGIGSAMAERIVAKLRRKMAKFALMIQRELPPELEAERGVFNDAYAALVALGHSAPEARQRIEQIAKAGTKFKSVEDVLEEIYRSQAK